MIKSSLTTFLVFAFSLLLSAQEVRWTSSNHIPSSQSNINPSKYDLYQIDFTALKTYLLQAPLRENVSLRNTDFIFSIPSPSGENWTFKIVESPIMQPGLQSRFPEIRTFIGQGMGDHAHASARFDFTLKGFHAQILIAGQTFYIDPYNDESLDLYMVYSREAFYANSSKSMASCDPQENRAVLEQGPINQKSIDNPHHIDLSETPIPAAAISNGSNLRTYRLALACAGEYASFHGGTVPQVLSAMATSMNRVNGVFVRDMSLEMIMVENNDEIIFLNSSTDPYSNGNGSAMLSQNQSTCDDIIGSSNYDIGHVYSTGGGGVAYLQSVCGSSKAGGVTGQSSPVGDPFDIDYVAHEMGHQWGGNHTQNNSCNRSSNAAYEPGSASTIMGYAGICSPNLQNNSDDHFNNHSYNEMYNFSVTGYGNSCATTSPSGNTPPTVSVRSSGFYIPKETPFELTAEASDINGDALTYCWEQHDLGPATSNSDDDLTAPSGNAPIFRSWSPTTDNTRVFPRLSNLVNNTTVIGELLPTYSRDLTFRCTVRDNAAEGGGVSDAEVAFEVSASAGPFVLTSPNSTVSWTGNSGQTVTWNVANTTASPINCSEVDIFLSVDGGYTYPYTLANNVPNIGNAIILVPNIATSQARIKVKASENIFFDISNQNFNIIPGIVNDIDAALLSIDQPSADVCGNSITPQITIMNFGNDNLTSLDIIYDFNGEINATSWTGNLLSNEMEILALPELTLESGNADLSVILLNPNGQTDQNASNNSSSVNFNVIIQSGLALPVSNNFNGAFPGADWEIVNPDGDITWENDIVSNDVDCNSSGVATINFYSYNETGETDDILSPFIDLNGATEPELTFDYAYKRYSNFYNDRMQVQIKLACSDNWATIWDKSNLELSTAGSQTSSYIPSCGDWASESIDLSAYAGSIIQVRFRGITGYGNNLYLDNILFSSTAILDCAGVPNGNAYEDDCGVCDDIVENDNQTCLDCAGVPNGSAYTDECGVCDDIVGNDNQTCLDCAGVPNGSAYTDECGVCDDIAENDNQTCLDCAGVPNGSAYTDECGVCDDIVENDNQTCLDCAGVPNGSAYIDECGVCDDIVGNDNQTCLDCAGVPNGSAYTDECGICDDIAENDNQTCLDCSGVPNGSAYIDECGVCDDIVGNDNQTCLDCAGVPNGSAYTDECGVCDDIVENDNQTCLDCAGVPNGDALPGSACEINESPGLWNENCQCEPEIPCEIYFIEYEILTDACVDDQPIINLLLNIGNPNGESQMNLFIDYTFNFDYDDENLNFDIPAEGGNVLIPLTLVSYGITVDITASIGEGFTACSLFIDELHDAFPTPECLPDCAGVIGGSSYLDECGVCDDIPENDNQTCLDCAGVANGSAYIDDCDTCVGGTTDLNPCIIGCMSPTSCNYNSEATVDDGSCIEPIDNCTVCNDSNDGLLLIDSDQDGICNAEEVALNGFYDSGNCSSLDVDIWVYESNTSNLLNTLTSILSDGSFSTDLNLPEGTYDIYIKLNGHLSKGYYDISVGYGINEIEILNPIAGDINGNDGINITDFSILNAAFNSLVGDPNYNPNADLNCDGGVNIIDVSILNQGFNQVGEHAELMP